MHNTCVNKTTKSDIINPKIVLYSLPFSGIVSNFEMIDIASKSGISAFEPLNNFELSVPDMEAAKRIRDYADSKGITIPCLSMFINLAEGECEESIALLKQYADIASVLGADFFHHTIISEFDNPDKVVPRKDKLMQKGIEIVREIYDYAESLGIKTVYEDQGYIFNGVENFGEFLSKVNRDVGVVADFGNIYQSRDDAASFIKAFSGRIVHVHLKDAKLMETDENQTGLLSLNGKCVYGAQMGEGIVDFEKCIGLLKEYNYNGYYSLEYFSIDDSGEMSQKALDYVNGLI